MATTQQNNPGAPAEQMNLVVDAARSAVALEFQIAERLDAKARGQMTVAGAWYALVTAVAGLALGQQIDHGTNMWLVAPLIGLASAAGVCLVVAMFLSYRVWRLRQEGEIAPDGLLNMVSDAHNPNVEVAEQLVLHYRALLARRRKNNKTRAVAFKRSVTWWVLALAFALGELLVALLALAEA